MAKLRSVTKSASSATWRSPGVEYSRNSQTLCTACQRRVQWNGERWIWRSPGVEYSRNSQTLCTACQRRVQWNGERWIHLTIYARGMHEARPDLDLVVESDDTWLAQKLALMEAGSA